MFGESGWESRRVLMNSHMDMYRAEKTFVTVTVTYHRIL